MSTWLAKVWSLPAGHPKTPYCRHDLCVMKHLEGAPVQAGHSRPAEAEWGPTYCPAPALPRHRQLLAQAAAERSRGPVRKSSTGQQRA